ncbi:cation diffusion facilitator family transporter [Agrococcus terreus]|uniref:Co/Zn/Cd cation transporter n=1 Tax=Agrococcus terreus TaxID=574649 RepID=A0ABQ2KFB3_9MICO|nr:cation transporter [Agrococcus terreus]GGN79257.1 Co/Zn/Cd cation transporter [Agrococcus terreus]
MRRIGRTDLPRAQREALRRATVVEWISLGYIAIAITLVGTVMGGSQAMRTAWIEDMLSTVPQIAFLVALLVIRRAPTRKHPYGYHRAMGVGHLVAGVALLAVGALLAFEAVSGLLRQEHPSIGTVELFGQTVWLGWLMVGTMLLILVPPIVLGRIKQRLARQLHSKLLLADADMSRADWTTHVGSIVGVLGVGMGIWWLDGAAAAFISAGILRDGARNTRAAILDLMDMRATTVDQSEPEPLIERIDATLRRKPWVRRAASRVRDEGHVFHVQAFVVPRRSKVRVEDVDRAVQSVVDLDWRVQDVAIAIVSELPSPESDGGRSLRGGGERASG